MTNLDQFKKNFEQDLLIKVVVALRHDRINQQYASNLARNVLDIFKDDKANEIFKRLNKLAESNADIFDILISRGNEYDARQKIEDINKVHEYLLREVN